MPFDSTTYAPANPIKPVSDVEIHARGFRTANPLDLDAMIAWLETMPAEGEYSDIDPDICLLGQWFARFGGEPSRDVRIEGWYVFASGGCMDVPRAWGRAAFLRPPYTYGAALSRFRALRDGGEPR